MTNGKIAALAILLFFSVALFQYLQVLDLKEEMRAKNALINLLDRDYTDLQSDYTALEAELDKTRLELGETQLSLLDAETSLNELRELNDTKSITTHILGVRDGKGVPIPLEIEIKKGMGRALIDIGEIFLEDDVQSTVKTAFALADVMSDGELAEKDAAIRIINPYKKSLSISGMSSGAIMTMSLIALGKNTTLKKDVMITGTIRGDGSIGPVLYIGQKAEAAKALNATVMLVPVGQKIPVSGIELIEISNIEEAMEYMLE
jgi:predicted S18 family serine protease